MFVSPYQQRCIHLQKISTTLWEYVWAEELNHDAVVVRLDAQVTTLIKRGLELVSEYERD